MKLQTIILSLLAALFAGAVVYQFRRRIGTVAARGLSLVVAVIVFGLSVWLRQ
jgi:carbon starvation protein CstA